jgi:serine/threonine-protein kinase
MSAAVADRNLLFGILALQMDFISKDALIGALHAWVLAKAKPLGEILAEQGRLTPELRQLLDVMVDRHIQVHQGDPQQSLGAVSSASSVRQELQEIADPDVQASVAQITIDPDGQDPRTVSYGSPSAATAGLRYRVLRPHARGGLGEVFVAEDTELHREVALKEIRKEHASNDDSRSRFVLEAEITGGLEHPGIVPIYGLGAYDDGRPFYAMRFIKGDNLKEAIARFHRSEGASRDPGERNVAFRELLGRFVDVCNAVAYAHSRGVLHRDLKPGNVMLGKYGETLLIDWGLAKPVGRPEALRDGGEATLRPGSADSSLLVTRLGSALGTPAFMSPEQAAGQLDQLGPASDIYSLGATLYALLTGQAPFEGDTAEVLRQARQGELRPPRQVKGNVPAALEAICLKAMALRPEQRYRTALELAADVEHWLADEPVSAWREPLTVRGRRWLKRHRVLVMAAVTALLVGTLSLGTATVVLSAMNDELRQANERETEARQQEEAARRQEEKARLREESARKLAQANFEMANQAAEDYLFKVVEDDRLKERDLTELRRKLILSAGDFYRRFIAARQSDPTLERMLGRAYLNLGMLKHELSEWEEALNDLTRARDVFQRLVDHAPGDAEHRYYLGMTVNDLGMWYVHRHRYLEAAKVLQRNLPLCEQLVKDHPDVKKYRELEKSCVLMQGVVQEWQSQIAQAEPHFRRALALQRGIVKDFPEADQKNDLTVDLVNLGIALRKLNRQKEARKCLEEALALNGKLVQAAPRNPKYRWITPWLNNHLFNTLRDLGEPDEAEKAMRRAVDARRQLATDFPTVPSFRITLVDDLANLVEPLTDRGNVKEAIPLGREAVRLGEKLMVEFPDEPAVRFNLGTACYCLARALHRAGAIVEGEKYRRRKVEIMTELCREYPQATGYQENLGIAHSGLQFLLSSTGRLTEARDEGAKAVAVLEKLARDHPSNAEHQFRLAEACLLQAQTLIGLGEPHQEVMRKGSAALRPLLKKGSNARFQRVAAALTLLSFPVPVPAPGGNQGLAAMADAQAASAGIAGQLTAADPLDVLQLTQQSHRKVHRIPLQAGKHYQIDLTGTFNTILRLEEWENHSLLFNDDVSPPTDLNSRLIFSPLKTAPYRLVVTSLQPGATGAYTLKVREAVPAGPPQVIPGKLSDADSSIDRKYYREHLLNLTGGLTYTIELVSRDIDARTGLSKLSGKVLAPGIRCIVGKDLVPRIDFTPTASGTFRLLVMSELEGQTGPYTVRIQAYKLAEP